MNAAEGVGRRSRSLDKLNSSLSLTLRHLNTVDSALRSARTKDNMAIMNHAITRNCASAIQSLYPQLNDYPKSVLSEMFLRRPLQIVDKAEDTLQFQEIVRLGSYAAICSAMVDRVFRKLTNNSRSTQALIEKILANTGTIIDKKVMDESMLYIEMRHLIVHNSGLMDARFTATYAHKFKHMGEGAMLPISKGAAKDGVGAVRKLCQEVDYALQ